MITKKLENKRILVTGGAGFIGSHLCEHFLNRGNRVICLDNLATGSMENMRNILLHPKFTFIHGDIREAKKCRTAVQGCDYVFHEAALGSVPRSIEQPLETHSVNTDGFLTVLTAAQDAGVSRFIYASSSAVYGNSKRLPKVEKQTGIPQSPYAITKQNNEMYAHNFIKFNDIEIVGLRYFNVFGKRQKQDGAYAAVIPIWINQLLNNLSPAINGDSTYSRDFTYVDDVILANELAAAIPTETLKLKASIYDINLYRRDAFSIVFNVAYNESTTLETLFHTLRDALAVYDVRISDASVVMRGKRDGDIPHSKADITRARYILGYEPKYTFEEGIALTCKWYYEQHTNRS